MLDPDTDQMNTDPKHCWKLSTTYSRSRDYVNADPGLKTHYVPPTHRGSPVSSVCKYPSNRLLLVALWHLWQLWTHLMNYYVRGGDNFVDVSPNYIHRFRKKKKNISLSHVPLKNEHSSCRYHTPCLYGILILTFCLWFQRDILVYSLSLVVPLNKISMFS